MHMSVVEYEKETKIPSEFPDIQENVENGIIMNGSKNENLNNKHDSDNVSSVDEAQSVISKSSMITEGGGSDRNRIMNLVKFAHEQAEETRMMLEKLSSNKHSGEENTSQSEGSLPHPPQRDKDSLSVSGESRSSTRPPPPHTPEMSPKLRQASSTDKQRDEGSDGESNNDSYISPGREKEENEDNNSASSSRSKDIRRQERARLIAEAKAKAAVEKRVIVDKLDAEKKAERQARRVSHSSAPSTPLHKNNDDNSSVLTSNSNNSGNKPNASRYSAVLSISKEDARRAAVTKVRLEAKKAAEAKAKAEILNREAKLKSLLAADRELRAQKRMHSIPTPGGASSGNGNPSGANLGLSPISFGNDVLKEAINGDIMGEGRGSGNGISTKEGGPPVKDLEGLPESAREALREGDLESAYAKEDIDAETVVTATTHDGRDGYSEMDASARSLAYPSQPGQCFPIDTNVNGLRQQLGFWDSLFMCTTTSTTDNKK